MNSEIIKSWLHKIIFKNAMFDQSGGFDQEKILRSPTGVFTDQKNFAQLLKLKNSNSWN